MASHPLTLFALNHHVLDHLVSFLSVHDAISFSYTCKAAHDLSIKSALHTVVLDRSIEQISKFKDYFFADASRFNHLKSLTLTKAVTLEVDQHATEPAAALADILEKAQKLEIFDCGSFEALVTASKGRIASVFPSLEHLSEIALLNSGSKTFKIIAELRAPGLRKVVFGHLEPTLQLRSCISTLTHYPRLETIAIAGGSVLRLMLPQVTIPSVHTLSLQSYIVPIDSVSSVFPNVQRITIRTDSYQRVSFPAGTPVAPATWQHTLAEAHIDAIDIHLWPLACPVRWLDLGLLVSGFSEEALLALGRSQPRILSCAYRIDADNLFWVRLPTLATDLRFLEVRIMELSKHRKVRAYPPHRA